MSKYTTEVRWFCESKYNGDDTEDIDAVIHATYLYILKPKLQNEIFDSTYYPIIAEKIIRHYYFREIGAETVGLWIFWMNTRFSELLPYYNKLWESALLEFDPFKDIDYTREGNKQGLNSEVLNGRNTETLNGGTSETTTESASEQGKGETAETGKSTDNRSESESGNVNSLGSSVDSSIYSSKDSGEENSTNSSVKNKVTDNDTTGTVSNIKVTDKDTTGTANNTKITDNDTTGTVNNTKVTDNETETNIDETTTGTVSHDVEDTRWDLYSDTPQGSVNGIDLDSNQTYLTNARKNTDVLDEDTTSTERHQGTTTGSLDETVTDTGRTTGTMDETVTDTGRTTGTMDETVTDSGMTTGTLDETVQENGISNDKKVFGKVVNVLENNNSETSEDVTNTSNKIASGNTEDERNVLATNEKLSNRVTDKKHTSDSERVGESTGTKSGNAQEQWLEHIAGKMNTISYSELLEKYRKTFLNIDLMFIKEFDDLFMRLW